MFTVERFMLIKELTFIKQPTDAIHVTVFVYACFYFLQGYCTKFWTTINQRQRKGVIVG